MRRTLLLFIVLLVISSALFLTGCAINATLSDKSFYKVQANDRIHKAILVDMSRIKADYTYRPDVDSHILLLVPLKTEANLPVGKYLNDNLLNYFNNIFDKATSISTEPNITVRPEILTIRSTSVVASVESEVTLKFTFLQKGQVPWTLMATGTSKESLSQSYLPSDGSRNGFNVSMEKAISDSLDKLTQEIFENKMRF